VSADIALLTIFVLSVFVGFEVISKVSAILHTPLMSGANAIHGVILVGSILVAGHAEGAAQITLALVAVVLATINIVGGFVVTDRMLEMFRRPDPHRAGETGPGNGGRSAAGVSSAERGSPAQSTPARSTGGAR
jgi:proton-translocating NAD(P)+ transhydrogenase subunit alpha